MINRFLLITSALFLLASCETATKNAVKGDASKASASAKSSVSKSKSLFGSAKETPADKLVGVGDRVLFDYDSSKLSSDAKLTLDKQSRFLRVNSDLTFTIEGHCDERGTREYNLALGEKKSYCG